MITRNYINITSDNGQYTIVGRMVAEQNCFSIAESETKQYSGSHWEVSIFHNGNKTSGIQINESGYQPFIHFGENACGLCQRVRLSKNTILFGAIVTHLFSQALKGINPDKVVTQYYKEYAKSNC